jgi:DNA-binding PucR family transcriptional regulator
VYAEPQERVFFDVRRHGVVLVRPFVRAVAIAVAGGFLLAMPWPVPMAAPAVIAAGAVSAFAAVWRWDRTRFVVTTDKVFLVQGVTRKRASAVRLHALRSISLEQSLLGRMLGYGTIHAGPLEIEHVPHAARARDLVERLAG